MPFGCVAFICPYMESWFTSAQLAALREDVAQLQQAYRALRTALLAER